MTSPVAGWTGLVCLLVAGCADTPADIDAVRWDVIVERGDAQTGPAGTILPEALLVQVLNNNVPVVGTFVTVRVLTGNGTVWSPGRGAVAGPGASLSERTGRDGRSEIFLGVGQTVGTFTFGVSVDALVNGDSVQTITATAVAGPPASVVQSGDHQSGQVSTLLPQALSLTIADAFGNLAPDVAVQWRVSTGGGMVADSATLTDANGQTSTQWELGSSAGTQTVEAVVDTLPPVVFTATGQN